MRAIACLLMLLGCVFIAGLAASPQRALPPAVVEDRGELDALQRDHFADEFIRSKARLLALTGEKIRIPIRLARHVG